MGFNIPYTHSEERPSRPLLTKSAVAGAQSLLLFLLGRTPGAPATIEIKPTATIAWREIGFGPIRRKGRPIALVDCPEPESVARSEEHTSELQSLAYLVCRLLLEKKKHIKVQLPCQDGHH